MIELGYWLSSEEHSPRDLIDYARQAEAAGFPFALISDHYHPWLDRQGQAPFVWSVMGSIAQVTRRLRLGTGVTCPIVRLHPAIVAQAAATAPSMLPGRFFLGLGSGEALNEHILGDRWPPVEMRQNMLEEAIKIIRLLWQGRQESYQGAYFTVENARLYTLPDEPPPLLVAAGGAGSAKIAGELGDGLIGIAANEELVKTFREAGGANKPLYAKLAVCWAEDKNEALRTAHRVWPNDSLGGFVTELPTPAHFEQAVQLVRPEDVAQTIITGPDPEPYLAKIREFAQAGFDHLALHQVGPDQAGFFRFYEKELRPRVEKEI